MNVQPTLEIHPHQEFHFAENTDSKGCCCFWKSRTRPNQYIVDDKNRLVAVRRCKYRERIIANQRLGEIIKSKFQDDPIENDEAFELLKAKINDPMKTGDPITDEKLVKIVNALYIVKEEFKRGH